MRKAFLFFLILFSLQAKAFATTYYISATGNNSNDGLSEEAPWLTCAKINGAATADGDTVLFKSGDTFTGNCQIPHDNFTFDIYGGVAHAIIDQQNSFVNCITYNAKTGVVINNIDGKNSTSDCFSAIASGDGIISDVNVTCSSTTGNDGFKQFGTTSYVYNDITATGCTQSTVADGFSLHDTSTATINNFESYANGNGISNEKGTTATCNNCNFHDNIYANAKGADSGTGTTTLTLNKTVLDGGDGFGFGDKNSSALGAYTCNYCVIKNAPSGQYGINILNSSSVMTLNNVTLDNNDGGIKTNSVSGSVNLNNVIISNSTAGNYFSFGGTGPVGRTFIKFSAYDVAIGDLSDQTAQFTTTNGTKYDQIFSAQPSYTDQASGDYTLKSSSVLINRGYAVGLTSDFNGNSIFGIPDIGAYEYQADIDRINNATISNGSF